MAESKFLKFQDKNNDGLIDACKVDVVPLVDDCPECKPNPTAIVPDWKLRNRDTPFLNERDGQFQITIVTDRTDTGGCDPDTGEELSEAEAAAALQGIFFENVYTAIQSLLGMFQKSMSNDVQELCREYIEYKKYDLGVAPTAKLKLLYGIDCALFTNLPSGAGNEEEEEDTDDEETEDDTAPTQIVIDAYTFSENLIVVRKGLELYNRYLKVFRAVDGGNLIFEEGPNTGAAFPLDDYGDKGFGPSLLAQAINGLDQFLRSRGIQIPGERFVSFALDRAVQVTLDLGEGTYGAGTAYRVIKISVLTESCGSEPVVFEGAAITAFVQEHTVFKDPITLNYLANLSSMHADLTARTPKNWLDFLIEYTSPKIYSSINHEMEDALEDPTAKSCLGATLETEGTELLQDALDPIFGIGDAIAYKFKDRLCNTSDGAAQQQKAAVGLIFSTDVDTSNTTPTSNSNVNPDNAEQSEPTSEDLRRAQLAISPTVYKNIRTYANEQAYKEIDNSTRELNICAFLQNFLGQVTNGNVGQKPYVLIPETAPHYLKHYTHNPPWNGRIDILTAPSTWDVSRMGWKESDLSTWQDAAGADRWGRIQSLTVGEKITNNHPHRNLMRVFLAQAQGALEVMTQAQADELNADRGLSPGDEGYADPAEGRQLTDTATRLLALDDDTSYTPPDAVSNAMNEILDSLTMCGFNELMLETMGCLFKGLTLEVSLTKIIQAALRGMNIRTFVDLFVGLPLEKRAEIDALVQKKLREGDIFREGSINQEMSDNIEEAMNVGIVDDPETNRDETYGTDENPIDIVVAAPAEENLLQATGGAENYSVLGTSELLDSLRLAATANQGGRTTNVFQNWGNAHTDEGQQGTMTRRPLVDEVNFASEERRSALSDTLVLELYIKCILEVYQENLLDMMDILNTLPGAQLISLAIAAVNCPAPPGGASNTYDFINDFELGANIFCSTNWHMALPDLSNPFQNIPKLRDLAYILKQVAKEALNEALAQILAAIIVKICKNISAAACTLLQQGASMLATLPSTTTGRSTIADVVKEGICGTDASEDDVENTIVEMVAAMGLGAAAFANKERVLEMMDDVSAALTPTELANLFLGEASPETLTIVDQIREQDYPEFGRGFPTRESIGRFFNNAGNALPLAFRQQLRDMVDNIGESTPRPVNMSMCASPADLEAFEEARCRLLQGRATSAQCREMSPTNENADELEELADIMQDLDGYIEDQMPNLLEEPGCGNGIFPIEPAVIQEATTTALGYELDSIKMAFADDMIGNGPWESDYGVLNMILSDTQGNPLSAHNRKVAMDIGAKSYVDYYVVSTSDETTGARYKPMYSQKGAYPVGVATWLQQQLGDSGAQVTATNAYQGDKIVGQYEYGRSGPEKLIDIGEDVFYNIMFEINAEEEVMNAIAGARKSTPDMQLVFQDNADGQGTHGNSYAWNQGYMFNFFMSDLYKSGSTIVNRPSDNIRLKIYSLNNTAPSRLEALGAKSAYLSQAEAEGLVGSDSGTPPYMTLLEMEFLAVDARISGSHFIGYGVDKDMSDYVKFLTCFTTYQQHNPQVVLLNEIIETSGYNSEIAMVEGFWNYYMAQLVNTIMLAVSGNTDAFRYGAELDIVSPGDLEYVVATGQTDSPGGTLYNEATVSVSEESGSAPTSREITSEDKILGMSRMQFEAEAAGDPVSNRVVYLDPVTFGGSYMNPPLYVKPMENKSWLGMVDVMFPEASPCRPHYTDAIDFSDIKAKIEETYNKVPQDARLNSDESCLKELPYSRILERASTSAIEGIISSLIRTHCVTHFLKTIATFTYFKPDFEENYSILYLQYIIENMEKSLKDSQASFWEFMNPFKDNEFWYAFLEQSVQLYSRRIGPNGDIAEDDVPSHVRESLTRLNNKIEVMSHRMLTKKEWKEARSASQKVGKVTLAVVTLGTSLLGARSYKKYRDQVVFDFVKETEEDAKIILAELVKEQLMKVSDRFLSQLAKVNWKPAVQDTAYYFIQNFMQGGADLDLDKEIKEEYSSLGEGNDLYTNGGDFTIGEGEDYVGYYHSETTSDGTIIYLEGSEDTGPNSLLTPTEARIIVPIGDVSEYDTISQGSATQPFILEKYVKIDGVKYTAADGIAKVRENPLDSNISDNYPGTLELILNDAGAAIGLKGELGVRTGLQVSVYLSEQDLDFYGFLSEINKRSDVIPDAVYQAVDLLLESIGVEDVYTLLAQSPAAQSTVTAYFNAYSTQTSYAEPQKVVILEIELDALDTTVSEFKGIPADSKLLLCLLNNLKDDEMFKLLTKYIMPVNKILSSVAIYNDVAFLSSIGQVSVQTGAGVGNADPATKPGRYIQTTTSGPYGAISMELVDGAPGWAHVNERDQGWFINEYDNWSRSLMRNVNRRAKKLFKGHYYGRSMEPAEAFKNNESERSDFQWTKTLRARLKPAAGDRLPMPRWKKKSLRSNPYDSSGKRLCEKE